MSKLPKAPASMPKAQTARCQRHRTGGEWGGVSPTSAD